MKKFILSLFCVLSALCVLSQKTITFNNGYVEIKELLKIISKETGYKFSYNPTIFDAKFKVLANIENADINDVLIKFLPNDITYKIHEKHIILFAKNGIKQDSQTEQKDKTVKNEPNISNTKNYVDTSPVKDYETVVENRKDSIFINRIPYNNTAQKLTPKDKIQISDYKFYTQYLSLNTNEIQLVKIEKPKKEKKEKKEKEYLPAPPSMSDNLFQASFIYPLGSGWVNSSKKTYDYSLSVLGGITGRTKKVELAGLFNINMYSSNGFQLAGVFNLSGTKYKESGNNIQISGVFNFNKFGQSTQISVVNYSEYSYFQLAVANVSKKSDIQIGVVNKTKESLFQFGIVNISDSAKIMIGFFNYSKNGIMRVSAEFDNFLGIMPSVRSGTKYFYGILNPTLSTKKEKFWTMGTGFGTTLIDKKVGVNLETSIYNFYSKETRTDNPENEKYNGLLQVKPIISYNLGRFNVFASPTINLSTFNDQFFRDIIPYNLINSNIDKISLWIGYSFGIGFKIL